MQGALVKSREVLKLHIVQLLCRAVQAQQGRRMSAQPGPSQQGQGDTNLLIKQFPPSLPKTASSGDRKRSDPLIQGSADQAIAAVTLASVTGHRDGSA